MRILKGVDRRFQSFTLFICLSSPLSSLPLLLRRAPIRTSRNKEFLAYVLYLGKKWCHHWQGQALVGSLAIWLLNNCVCQKMKLSEISNFEEKGSFLLTVLEVSSVINWPHYFVQGSTLECRAEQNQSPCPGRKREGEANWSPSVPFRAYLQWPKHPSVGRTS
jgi:hypothetical protein